MQVQGGPREIARFKLRDHGVSQFAPTMCQFSGKTQRSSLA